MDRPARSVTNCRKLAEGVEFFDCCEKLPEGAGFFDFRAKMPLTAMRQVGRFAATPKRGEDPMSTSAYTRLSVIILAALALAACPEKKVKKHDETPTAYWVSPAGSDTTNPGTEASPFKTITNAMRVATRSGTTVHVAPGTYTSGEAFPITVPAGVLLIGDEPNKGGGSTPTSIVGGGGQAPGATAGFGVALLPGAGSTIAGFTITNNNPGLSGRYGLFLSNSSVTLRNNTVTGATHKVGIYIDASTNH